MQVVFVLALVAIAGAMGWVAWEMRQVHRWLRCYTHEIEQFRLLATTLDAQDPMAGEDD
jgi:hypothetical protein